MKVFFLTPCEVGIGLPTIKLGSKNKDNLKRPFSSLLKALIVLQFKLDKFFTKKVILHFNVYLPFDFLKGNTGLEV